MARISLSGCVFHTPITNLWFNLSQSGDRDRNRDAHRDDPIAPASWPSVTQQDPCQRQIQPPQVGGFGAVAYGWGIRSIRHCDAVVNPIMPCASSFCLVSWIIVIIHDSQISDSETTSGLSPTGRSSAWPTTPPGRCRVGNASHRPRGTRLVTGWLSFVTSSAALRLANPARRG